jgi:hypothetical protein
MRGWKRWTAAISLAGVFPLMFGASCYGHFPMVRTIYKFNGSVKVGGPKATGVVQSLLMILLAVVPVYGISALLDIVLFNLIEFWSGRPVFTAHTLEDGSRITMRSIDEKTLEIEVLKEGKTSTFYALKEKPSEIFIIQDGEFVAVEAGYMDTGALRTSTAHANGELLGAKIHLKSEVESLEREAGLSAIK